MGKPCIKGTRIPIYILLQKMASLGMKLYFTDFFDASKEPPTDYEKVMGFPG